MARCENLVVGIALAALIAGLSPAFAQNTTFRNYHCADGTDFIVGAYPYDSRVYLQIDGGAVTLRKRLALWGTRYSGAGVTLKVSKSGVTTVRRARQPETACDLKQTSVQ